MTFSKLKFTFAQETAITILAPALAIPLASDLDPTYQINEHLNLIFKTDLYPNENLPIKHG